jgi:hypothetical protein
MCMEQDFGSLYDLLHNETVPIERDSTMQLLRDISQGAGQSLLNQKYFLQ